MKFKIYRHLKAGRPSKNLGRYMAYFVFAVGTPVLIVFSSGLLDNAYKLVDWKFKRKLVYGRI